jgi:hypothetical protein
VRVHCVACASIPSTFSPWLAGVAFAAGASAPAVLLCLAAGAALITGRLIGHWFALPRLSIVAAIIAIIASPALVVMSFGVAPARSMSLRLECVRFGWILLWFATSWLVVGAIVTAV